MSTAFFQPGAQFQVVIDLTVEYDPDAAIKIAPESPDVYGNLGLLERAKGKRDSTKTEADGNAYKTLTEGKAEADVVKLKFQAKGEGLQSIAQKLKLEKGDEKLVLLTEQSIEMFQGANYAYLSGDGGIGQMAMSFLDRAAKAFEKVRSDDPKTQKLGVDEIKKAWADLPEKDQKELEKMVDEKSQPEDEKEKKKKGDKK